MEAIRRRSPRLLGTRVTLDGTRVTVIGASAARLLVSRSRSAHPDARTPDTGVTGLQFDTCRPSRPGDLTTSVRWKRRLSNWRRWSAPGSSLSRPAGTRDRTHTTRRCVTIWSARCGRHSSQPSGDGAHPHDWVPRALRPLCSDRSMPDSWSSRFGLHWVPKPQAGAAARGRGTVPATAPARSAQPLPGWASRSSPFTWGAWAESAAPDWRVPRRTAHRQCRGPARHPGSDYLVVSWRPARRVEQNPHRRDSRAWRTPETVAIARSRSLSSSTAGAALLARSVATRARRSNPACGRPVWPRRGRFAVEEIGVFGTALTELLTALPRSPWCARAGRVQ